MTTTKSNAAHGAARDSRTGLSPSSKQAAPGLVRRESAGAGFVQNHVAAPPVRWVTDRAAIACANMQVLWEDFCGKGRHPRTVFARNVVVYTAKGKRK